MAKHPSMDTIRTPDLNNLKGKQNTNLNTYDRYTRAEDHTGKVRAEFSSVSAKHQDIYMKSKEPPKDEAVIMAEEFSAKRRVTKAPDTLGKGVKVVGSYVAVRRIVSVVIVITLVVFLAAFLLPPIYTSNDSESSCRREDIFGKTGATQYRSDLVNNHYVYNLDALDSDKSSSYRICTLAFDARNYGPFAVELENYVISDGGDYSSNIVYSQFTGDSNVIPAFTTKKVTIEVLIKKDGLTDEEFDKAITSLTLHSTGTKKKIAKNATIPCIPAWLTISDVISFDPD